MFNVSGTFLEHHGRARSVLVDPVARFKGLEAQDVVLWLGEEMTDDKQWETVCVGATRATSLLCIIGSPRTLKALRANGAADH